MGNLSQLQKNTEEQVCLAKQLAKSLMLEAWKPDVFRSGSVKFETLSQGSHYELKLKDLTIRCFLKETGELIEQWKGNEIPHEILMLIIPEQVKRLLNFTHTSARHTGDY